ncbi:MAG: NAD(P)H-dependent glycerol-3-phosphate dehydrogenase [Pseudomonadota bacterium]
MSLAILGAGAFGTALAIAFARDGQDIVLWGRDEAVASHMQTARMSGPNLPGHQLPDSLRVTSDLSSLDASICLLAVPSRSLSTVATKVSDRSESVVACCKGVDEATGLGPVRTLQIIHPNKTCAMLTGPSFAADVATGLPTALVLACEDEVASEQLQGELARPLLRIYRSTDIIGAELGGALKNVIALAAGMTLGAGLGDSARASVISRGFAEMVRYATAKGASLETLQGLSGLGDLVLTCTSEKSRNFTAGLALGQGRQPTAGTIEGIFTAQALERDAASMDLDLPLIATVSRVVRGQLDMSGAIATLLARPVGKE